MYIWYLLCRRPAPRTVRHSNPLASPLKRPCPPHHPPLEDRTITYAPANGARQIYRGFFVCLFVCFHLGPYKSRQWFATRRQSEPDHYIITAPRETLLFSDFYYDSFACSSAQYITPPSSSATPPPWPLDPVSYSPDRIYDRRHSSIKTSPPSAECTRSTRGTAGVGWRSEWVRVSEKIPRGSKTGGGGWGGVMEKWLLRRERASERVLFPGQYFDLKKNKSKSVAELITP